MGSQAEQSAIKALLAVDRSGANGDDAAVLHAPGGRVCVTTDTAVDGVHLDARLTPFERGYRAAACALSDLAAMAALPLGVTSALVVPAGGWGEVAQVSAGIEQRCAEHGCHLVGGDLVAAAPGDVAGAITITCIGGAGSAAAGGFLTRAGARPGDVVFVTGELGRSSAARSDDALPWSWYAAPPNRGRAAQAIAPWTTALCDLSDGIATDARHIATSSGVGLVIDLDLLPVDGAVSAVLAASTAGDGLVAAACAGDDYELLGCVAPGDVDALRAALNAGDPSLRLTIIGEVADSTHTVFFRGGRALGDGLRGYAHG